MVLQEEVGLRDESGQVLALGAVSMLVLALMLMISFNLSEAIHNKIQLQQQADAEAYSMAVVEARTFNYIAFSNRAIAADLVAMATMHAYMSMMSAEVSMLGSGGINMLEAMVIFEIPQCDPPWGLIHCWHAIDDGIKAGKYFRAKRQWGQKLQGLRKWFNYSIEALQASINIIHMSQWLMFLYTAQVVAGQDLKEIQSYNAPQSSTSLPGGVMLANWQNLACAAQGSFIDSLCRHDRLSPKDQSRLLAEVANASRPKWTSHQGLDFVGLILTQIGEQLMFKIPGRSGFTMPVGEKGTAKLVHGRNKLNGSDEAIDAQDVGAEDSGYTFSKIHDGFGFSGFSADIYSDKNGGKHDPGAAHTGQHKEYKGLYDCWTSPKTCFIKFRADKNKNDNFDQPMVYYYATRDLSVNRNGKHGPWELNKQGQIKVGFGPQHASLTLRAGTGAALSQAMVYYHRLGDWQDAPNFFSPYWRAKLQPMDAKTAAKILLLAGNTDAAEIALAKGPVD